MKTSQSPLYLLFLLLFGFSLLQTEAQAQIKSGPMLGYSEMKEVLIWVQTKYEATVQIKYWDIKQPNKVLETEKIKTQKSQAYIARLLADEVDMDKRYRYEVYVDSKKMNISYPLEFQTQALWQYRKDPPSFSFIYGSCNYINEAETDRPGRPYGGADSIYTEIYKHRPDFMIWGGDNFYYREPDWNTRTGMIHRNDHTRAVPSLQPLLASTHHYAVWDDHDYGPNDADRSWVNKHMALDLFKLYWGNPSFTFPNEAVTGQFQWADVDFFVMDDRWFKAPNDLKDPTKDYFGQKQMQWLLDALSNSRASFKIIVNGGQVLNPAKIFENMANYESERNQLLQGLQERKISGVLFLTGDRHTSSFWKLNRTGTYPLHEVTASPLTAGAAKAHPLDTNEVLVPGTIVSEQAFAKLEVSGPLKDRVLTVKLIDTKGKVLWEQKLSANQLK